MPDCGWGVRVELPRVEGDVLAVLPDSKIIACRRLATVMYLVWSRPSKALSGGGVRSALYLCNEHDPHRHRTSHGSTE